MKGVLEVCEGKDLLTALNTTFLSDDDYDRAMSGSFRNARLTEPPGLDDAESLQFSYLSLSSESVHLDEAVATTWEPFEGGGGTQVPGEADLGSQTPTRHD